MRRLKERAALIFAWSRYEPGDKPPDALGYDSTARLLLEAAERIAEAQGSATDGKCPECGLPIEECNKRALTRWRHRGDQTKEIERLRAELAAAREVISHIVERWDDDKDREGNERYGGMALYEDLEPEMVKARAVLERIKTGGDDE